MVAARRLLAIPQPRSKPGMRLAKCQPTPLVRAACSPLHMAIEVRLRLSCTAATCNHRVAVEGIGYLIKLLWPDYNGEEIRHLMKLLSSELKLLINKSSKELQFVVEKKMTKLGTHKPGAG